MTTIVLTGAAGALGRRVCARLAADEAVDRVLALDRRPLADLPAGVDGRVVDLAVDDLKGLLEGADAVVHLAADEIEAGRRVLDAAGTVAVGQVVVLSSATTYGAWANNPVPLTEEAPLRPNPGLDYAVNRAELERVAADWRDQHPSATVAVLRPTVALAEDATEWMARSLRAAAGLKVGDEEPPAQFVHLDDLAAAVHLACRRRLDGAFNVAPDGWISGETLRALAGGRPRLALTERAAMRLLAWRARLGWPAVPAGLLPYTAHPWVVANDRLRAAGWEPEHSNEEAFVAGHQPSRWETLSPKRRQELALAGAATVLAAAAAGAVALLRRRHR